MSEALSFPCPTCKVSAGNFCEDSSGKWPSDRQHASRLQLAANNPYRKQGEHEPLCTKSRDHKAECDCRLSVNYLPPVEVVKPDPKPDPINPSHYKGDLVMRIIEHFGLSEDFPLANVIKYILRHKEKAGLEDLKKARWYLDRRIAQLDGSLPKGTLS